MMTIIGTHLTMAEIESTYGPFLASKLRESFIDVPCEN